MFIAGVDQALEALLRARLPLPPQVGDVSFDPPNETWSASLSRLTVNLFLYNVGRSGQPSRAPVARGGEDGTPAEKRRLLPMIELGYLVSAWAGSPRDEHQLLGDVLSICAGLSLLPDEFMPEGLNSSVALQLGDELKPREVWQSVGGKLKPSFVMRCTVAADTWDWELQAPPVERIQALSDRVPNGSTADREYLAGGLRRNRR